MSEQSDTGGPAHPTIISNDDGTASTMRDQGMSLLDYFAGQAMAGMLANPDEVTVARLHAKEIGATSAEVTSQWAYSIAQIMIEEKRQRETH